MSSVAMPEGIIHPTRPPVLTSIKLSSVNTLYVFTSPLPQSGNRFEFLIIAELPSACLFASMKA